MRGIFWKTRQRKPSNDRDNFSQLLRDEHRQHISRVAAVGAGLAATARSEPRCRLLMWTAPAPGIECHRLVRRRRRKSSLLFCVTAKDAIGTSRHFAASQ